MVSKTLCIIYKVNSFPWIVSSQSHRYTGHLHPISYQTPFPNYHFRQINQQKEEVVIFRQE